MELMNEGTDNGITELEEYPLSFISCRIADYLAFQSRRSLNDGMFRIYVGEPDSVDEPPGDGIELYGFIFLSSHFHFLLRDTKGQLAQFMWYFRDRPFGFTLRAGGIPFGAAKHRRDIQFRPKRDPLALRSNCKAISLLLGLFQHPGSG